MQNVQQKRKRIDDISGYNKKPRFDKGRNGWNPQQYFQNPNSTPTWANSYNFPPPVKPENFTAAPQQVVVPQQQAEPEPEEPVKPALPIPVLEASFNHSIFWHRSIGSVFPLIPATHFATSHCSDVPAVFLPKPPTNRVQGEFCPNLHLFRTKFRPPKAQAGSPSKSKRNKPIQFLHVFEGYATSTRLEDVCMEWRKKYATVVSYGVNNEDAKALCRDSNLWFGQFCLVCERELSHKSAGPHFRGKSHLRKYQTMPIKATYERVDPVFVRMDSYRFQPTTKEHKKPFPVFFSEFARSHTRLKDFLDTLDLHSTTNSSPRRILVLGDFDMTFSLGIYRATDGQKDSKGKQLRHTIVCAPCKIADSDMRIKRNMQTCENLNIEIMKDIKLFDPESMKFDEPFDKIFVLFPRVSFLTNLADPLNSRFLQDLFRVINKNSIIRPDGYVYLLMKRREFVDWDVCTVALQEKLYLQRAIYHQAGLLPPFEPRQPAGDANSKAKRLNGIKSPLYYVFARTREQGYRGVNPWVEAVSEPSTGISDADAVLQNLENQFKQDVKEE